MTDVVKRLRRAYERRSGAGHWDMMKEAADELEKAYRLIGQSIQWQREAEIKIARLQRHSPAGAAGAASE